MAIIPYDNNPKFTIKYRGRIYKVYPYEIYHTYEVGDVIDGECHGKIIIKNDDHDDRKRKHKSH